MPELDWCRAVARSLIGRKGVYLCIYVYIPQERSLSRGINATYNKYLRMHLATAQGECVSLLLHDVQRFYFSFMTFSILTNLKVANKATVNDGRDQETSLAEIGK